MVRVISKEIENVNGCLMKCSNCKRYFNENEIQEHHIHPKFMDNPGGKGQLFPLCNKCHGVIHGYITKWLYKIIDNKDMAIKTIIENTKCFFNIKDDFEQRCSNCTQSLDIEDIIFQNKCPTCKKEITKKEDLI